MDELNSVPEKVKPEEIKLAKQVIGTFEGPLDLATYKDEYREGLQQIIDAKIAGEEIVAPQVEAPQKVVNLMDALKKSLDAVRTRRRRRRPRQPLRRPSASERSPQTAVRRSRGPRAFVDLERRTPNAERRTTNAERRDRS